MISLAPLLSVLRDTEAMSEMAQQLLAACRDVGEAGARETRGTRVTVACLPAHWHSTPLPCQAFFS